VLVGEYQTRDKNHARARKLVEGLASGAHGRVMATDYIIAETLNYAVAKCRDRDLPERLAKNLLGEDGVRWIQIRAVDELIWSTARQRFRVLSRAGLSFTDCTSLATIEHLKLGGIVSFDSGFDGLVPRFS
jgi:hypothetical protein